MEGGTTGLKIGRQVFPQTSLDFEHLNTALAEAADLVDIERESKLFSAAKKNRLWKKIDSLTTGLSSPSVSRVQTLEESDELSNSQLVRDFDDILSEFSEDISNSKQTTLFDIETKNSPQSPKWEQAMKEIDSTLSENESIFNMENLNDTIDSISSMDATCPVCSTPLNSQDLVTLNKHLDECLASSPPDNVYESWSSLFGNENDSETKKTDSKIELSIIPEYERSPFQMFASDGNLIPTRQYEQLPNFDTPISKSVGDEAIYLKSPYYTNKRTVMAYSSTEPSPIPIFSEGKLQHHSSNSVPDYDFSSSNPSPSRSFNHALSQHRLNPAKGPKSVIVESPYRPQQPLPPKHYYPSHSHYVRRLGKQKTPIFIGGEKRVSNFIFNPEKFVLRKKLKEGFEKYSLDLRNAETLVQATLDSVKRQEFSTMREFALEMDNVKKWASKDLNRSARSYALAKHHFFTVSKQIEEIKLEILIQKEKDLKFLSKKISENLPCLKYYGSNFFVPVKTLFACHPTLLATVRTLRHVSNEAKLKLDSFLKLKASHRMISNDVRAKKLAVILDKTLTASNASAGDYFETIISLQTEFNELILDERYHEGRQIAKLSELLKYNKEDFRPEEVLACLEQFSKDICSEMKVQTALNKSKVSLYVNRAVWERIWSFCFGHWESVETLNLNLLFDEKRAKFGKYSVLELKAAGLLDLFPDDDLMKLNFGPAIEQLDFLSFELAPRDMIAAVQKSIAALIQEIKSSWKTDVGADGLFPLFCCVLLRCMVPDTFTVISFLQNFLSESDMRGESGYCLVTLQATATHIATGM